ncbi:MAG TPA: TIGR03118 family protein [Kofleriaceae bacterium]|jgi:uncharacterized protein (TIGR03118 family)|nr:TIGR03118 family protein [Kofleriaceae bacterium]
MQAHSALTRIALASLVVLGACDDDDDDIDQIPGELERCFQRVDLVSNVPGAALRTDPNLINAWGITSELGAFAINATDSGVLAMYNADGTPASTGIPDGLQVGEGYTGITRLDDTLILVSEDGLISTIVPDDDPTRLNVEIDEGAAGASFKGVTIYNDRVVAADFARARIEVFNRLFEPVPDKTFINPAIPAGYAPFNVAAFNETLYVTYALQDTEGDEEVTGAGLGFVAAFNHNQDVLWTISSDLFNAPWGMAIAPLGFGDLQGTLLVGNFGDGRITIVDPALGSVVGQVSDVNGVPIVTDGLWGLVTGERVNDARSDAIYFTAGPAEETQGLYGVLVPCD